MSGYLDVLMERASTLEICHVGLTSGRITSVLMPEPQILYIDLRPGYWSNVMRWTEMEWTVQADKGLSQLNTCLVLSGSRNNDKCDGADANLVLNAAFAEVTWTLRRCHGRSSMFLL